MTTKRKKGKSLQFLESLMGGPLTIGALLEAIRLGEELSQTAFAEMLGISKAHLCDIENGRRKLSPARAARFATLLGYSSERFVKLVFQEELDREGLDLAVEIRKRPRSAA